MLLVFEEVRSKRRELEERRFSVQFNEGTIFLGLTVSVYRFSPVDVDSKKRFSQFS